MAARAARARDAGARAHRPRRHERRRRALQGLQGERDQADLGLEAYLVDDRRRARAPSSATTSPCWRPPTRAFATSSSSPRLGFLEGFGRGKPSVDTELLDRHSEGVIALTGCLQSRFCRRLVEERPADARAHARRAARHLRARQRLLRDPGERAGRAGEGQRGHRPGRRGARPAAGGDGRRPLPAPRGLLEPRGAALRADQVDDRAARSCASTPTSSSSRAPTRWPSRSRAGRRRCRRRSRSPSGATSRSSSGSCCCPASRRPRARSLPRCCAGSPPRACAAATAIPPPAEARERLEFELSVIGEMGFDSYFLIVWDFVKYAKDNGIAVGPGRGSAAGSIVAYCLNITDLDPLANGLLFERFLNPARKSMPDIDIDFSVRGSRAGDPLRGREVRARVGGADHHLRQDGPSRRHPRRGPGAGLRLRDRRPDRQADPRAGAGAEPELRRVPQGRRGAEAHLRLRSGRAPHPRRRPRARGDRPQQLDPRRGRGDRRPPAGRDRPAPAGRGSRRRRRTRGGPNGRPASAPTRSSPSTRWGRSRRWAC